MLVLSRKIDEGIVLPDCEATITVLDIGGGRVRLGIAAPASIAVHRDETWAKIQQNVASALGSMATTNRSLRVLVADADSQRRRRYSALLPSDHITIATAAGGTECVDQLQTSLPDLLILDSALPGGQALAVLGAMRQCVDMETIPVILLGAASVSPEYVQPRPPIIDRLVSPIDSRRLLQGIRALFAYRQWRMALDTEEQNAPYPLGIRIHELESPAAPFCEHEDRQPSALP